MGIPNKPLFPGKKYEVTYRRHSLTPESLQTETESLSRELGPDHPRVKALLKQMKDMSKARK